MLDGWKKHDGGIINRSGRPIATVACEENDYAASNVGSNPMIRKRYGKEQDVYLKIQFLSNNSSSVQQNSKNP